MGKVFQTLGNNFLGSIGGSGVHYLCRHGISLNELVHMNPPTEVLRGLRLAMLVRYERAPSHVRSDL